MERRAPFFPMGNLAGWCDALFGVLNYGELEQAIHAIRHTGGALRTCEFVRNMFSSIELMPPVDERYLPFRDDWSKDVQFVPRKNAETVMLVFSGRGIPGLGMPTNMVHRWLGRLPVSLVYLRDLVDASEFSYYLGGIASLGKDRDATLIELRRLVSALGGRRIVCYSNSGGVFGALHYGLDLKAEAVLCLGGATNLSVKFDSGRRMNGALPKVDLRRAYSTAERPPRARIVYAEHHWDDRIQAEYMSGVPAVTLHALSRATGHNVMRYLVKRREYDDHLDWLVSQGSERDALD